MVGINWDFRQYGLCFVISGNKSHTASTTAKALHNVGRCEVEVGFVAGIGEWCIEYEADVINAVSVFTFVIFAHVC
jgi:hypothetical protein